ncbi:DNA topoisomerase II [Kwoniella heveanensis BCC8398]|uniref:DNA topoisomerase 2 n=1 Tax=Kwoniella heveanensis BCC8398 TaxID=1296120 RepID=A0A1B9GPK9_9TREE|nr:DNA topoisomerase II [Kwoniella heveanensis BCC8398]
MSDSESDAFQIDDGGSESDGYVQPTKAKKAAAEKKAPVERKAPAKKAAAPKAAKIPAPKKPAAKKAPLASKNLPNDSMSDVESDFADSPVKSKLKPADDDDDIPINTAPATKKSASEVYQKLSQREHVLKRPDTYIGSTEAITQKMWVFDQETKNMAFRDITFVPGFLKIFDEILVNAADNKINDSSMDQIKVVIDREKNTISVYNNGKGIPVEMHKKENVMIPELIFGHLLAGSNFDDDQKKLTGGRNGYGAKLANIYSHEFIVETADKVNGKKYKQVFSNNMSNKAQPKVTENKKGEEWTKITFTPDLQRFGMTSIDDDTNALLMKRVYDMAGTVKDIKVFLNDERLKVKGFKQYVEMYLSASAAASAPDGVAAPRPTMVYEVVNKRWEVAFALSDGEMKQVSFANSIATTKGGTHVDMITTQLANKLMDQIKKKNKAAPVKPFQVKNHMWIFINALVENPAFDSQTKENLTLKSSAFGSKCDLSEDFVKKVAKTGIIDNVLSWARFKQDQIMKKMDGTKRTRISGIVKLEDANSAGGRNAKKCTLILTEGDSAKALAVSGLSVVGRDEYGVFPLRGKLLNVREAGHDQIVKNIELQHIRQILGLKHNQDYTSVDSLRYGHLMIMTDQDHDGSHIKGLLINFLDHFYPSLLRIPDFLVEFITPIVKVWKGKQEHTFYTMPQYEEWKEKNNDGKGWESKYYKGLGTSTSADAKKYFSDLDKHRLGFEPLQPEDRQLIDMAFNKKKADDRKEWLRQFRPGTFLDHNVQSLPISDFVNKELILFSMADNIRSIPSVADGLKPGQRKVLFGAIKKNLKREIKVAQLAGYVSENTAYHHGEQSLTSTIVGLAQNFVGSNNINLLSPNGQFGTRLSGGKDAASARYIFTDIPRITRSIFHPADDGLLNYLTEEGMSIEPDYYLPTVPLVLLNGADGIGTGWSTQIPNYNPVDVVANIRRLMRGEEPEKMNPWFRGFKGSIERVEQDKYKVSGTIEKIDDKTLEITELPVRKWTQDFKEMLEEMTTGTEKVPATIKDYEEHHTDLTVHFRVHMTEANMKAAEEEGFDKKFKLTTTLSTGNMVCFDLNGKIRKYTSAEEILSEFFTKRLEFYGLRKQWLADEINKQFERLSNQARFVQMIIAKELNVNNKKRSNLVAELRSLKFKPFPKKAVAKAAGEEEPTLDEEDEGLASDYDYLLGMAIWSLTQEKVEKLLHERDVKEQELIELLKLTPQDIWNADLDNFLAEWELCLEEDVAALKGAKPKTKTALKAAIKKKKRAAGEDSGDSEDDFKPVKAAAKPRAKPKATAGTKENSKSPVKRERAQVSDGSEVDVKPAAKKVAPTKPAPAKPAAAKAKPKVETVMDLDDSDDDMYTIPAKVAPMKAKIESIVDADSDDEPIKPKPKAKPAPKKKISAPVSDGSDSDIIPTSKPAPAKAAKKAPAAKAKPKAKKVESDFDDDDSMIADDFVPSPIAPRAGRGGRSATKKPAYIEMSDLDDDDD